MDTITTHSVMGQEYTSYVYDEAEVLSESEESLHQEGNKEERAENRRLELRVIRRGVNYVYLHISFK